MKTWLISNIGNIVVLLVLFALIFFIVRSLVKKNKSGRGFCACSSGGSCGGCSSGTCKSCAGSEENLSNINEKL